MAGASVAGIVANAGLAAEGAAAKFKGLGRATAVAGSAAGDMTTQVNTLAKLLGANDLLAYEKGLYKLKVGFQLNTAAAKGLADRFREMAKTGHLSTIELMGLVDTLKKSSLTAGMTTKQMAKFADTLQKRVKVGTQEAAKYLVQLREEFPELIKNIQNLDYSPIMAGTVLLEKGEEAFAAYRQVTGEVSDDVLDFTKKQLRANVAIKEAMLEFSKAVKPMTVFLTKIQKMTATLLPFIKILGAAGAAMLAFKGIGKLVGTTAAASAGLPGSAASHAAATRATQAAAGGMMGMKLANFAVMLGKVAKYGTLLFVAFKLFTPVLKGMVTALTPWVTAIGNILKEVGTYLSKFGKAVGGVITDVARYIGILGKVEVAPSTQIRAGSQMMTGGYGGKRPEQVLRTYTDPKLAALKRGVGRAVGAVEEDSFKGWSPRTIAAAKKNYAHLKALQDKIAEEEKIRAEVRTRVFMKSEDINFNVFRKYIELKKKAEQGVTVLTAKLRQDQAEAEIAFLEQIGTFGEVIYRAEVRRNKAIAVRLKKLQEAVAQGKKTVVEMDRILATQTDISKLASAQERKKRAMVNIVRYELETTKVLYDLENKRFQTQLKFLDAQGRKVQYQEEMIGYTREILKAVYAPPGAIVQTEKQVLVLMANRLELAKAELKVVQQKNDGTAKANEKIIQARLKVHKIEAGIAKQADHIRRTWMESFTQIMLGAQTGTYLLPGATQLPGVMERGAAFRPFGPTNAKRGAGIYSAIYEKELGPALAQARSFGERAIFQNQSIVNKAIKQFSTGIKMFSEAVAHNAKNIKALVTGRG